MASRSPSSARTTSTKRGSSSGRPSTQRKGHSRARSYARTTKVSPSKSNKPRAAGVSRHFGAVRRDVSGILLVLVGVLTGLGVYAEAAGPVGAMLTGLALGVFGLVGYAIPVVVVVSGLLTVINRPDVDGGRLFVGASLFGAGLLVALHLGVGSPDPAEGLRVLWQAGGLIGWLLATPLAWALSQWGAIAVLVTLMLVGILVATHTSFADVLGAVRRVVTSRREAPVNDETAEIEVVDPIPTDLSQHDTPAPRATFDAPEEPVDLADTAVIADTETTIDDPPADEARVPEMPTKARKIAPVRSWDDYELPSYDLLASGRSLGQESERTIAAQVDALQATFEQFGVDAKVARWSRGPTVTRFEIELGPGVQVKKVANMGDDIAYALAAPDVRIVAPIPGKSAIGVEVPNRKRDLITLGDVLRSDDAQADPHPLTVALGVDIAGKPALVNLTTMPHLLVSGATGSGKSVTLNGMISSVIMRARPDQVRMILIDPKRVELNAYEGAPHLLSPVVTDPRRATDAVQWCVKEMEQRYEVLAIEGYRNLDGYNEAVRAGRVASRPGPDGQDIAPREFPYILLVIDELADLMLVAPRDVEDAICRIAQMARAVGIHMIIATQRPSVDVITGLIKANIPSRLALAVASQTDSRTILDANGAEKLVGKGDMLFLPASQGKPSRLQGCWVTETEVANIVAFCKAQREAEFDGSVLKAGEEAARTDAQRSGDDNSDEALVRRAAEQVIQSGLGSTSMLQRKLRVGFARAGRLMDELEQLGVVGPNEGSKARDVLWDVEQLEDARQRGVL